MARRSGAGGIIAAALLLGVITAVMLGSWLRNKEQGVKANWLPVVVAAQEIPARTKITREMVRIDHFPKELIAENIFTKPEEVENRITKETIKPKEQIRKGDILGLGESATLALRVAPGMRAVAISVDEVRGVGTAVQPGDHVDIIASFQDLRNKQITTKMILQNVLVLFVDKGKTDADGKQGATSSVTLQVKPEQTELVKAAERSGTLNVTLRPVQDAAIIPSEGVTERELGGGQPLTETTTQTDRTPVMIIPPSATTRQKPEITLIRGTAEQTVTP